MRQANDKETGKLQIVENDIKRMKQGKVMRWGRRVLRVRETSGGGGGDIQAEVLIYGMTFMAVPSLPGSQQMLHGYF